MRKNDKKDYKKEFVISLILIGFGLYVLVSSVDMIFVDIPGVKREGWFVAPGVFPFFLSLGLIIMAITLLIKSKKKSKKFTKEDYKKLIIYFKSKHFWIILSEALTLIVFVFILLGRIKFEFATGIYLIVSMAIVKATKWYKIIIISITLSFLIGWIFGDLMNVPLP